MKTLLTPPCFLAFFVFLFTGFSALAAGTYSDDSLIMAGYTPQNGFSLYTVNDGALALVGNYPKGRPVNQGTSGDTYGEQEIQVLGDTIFFNMQSDIGGENVELWKFANGAFTRLSEGANVVEHVSDLTKFGDRLYFKAEVAGIGWGIFSISENESAPVYAQREDGEVFWDAEDLIKLPAGLFAADYEGNWWRISGNRATDTGQKTFGYESGGAVVGSVFYSDGETYELYAFDGTTSAQVTDIDPVEEDADVYNIHAYDSHVIFEAYAAVVYDEGLYTYRQETGTTLIATDGQSGDDFGGLYYYFLESELEVSELWTWNGTNRVQVMGSPFAGNAGNIDAIKSTGSELIISWEPEAGDVELWSYDGTAYALVNVPSSYSRSFRDIQNAGGDVVVHIGTNIQYSHKSYLYSDLALTELTPGEAATEDSRINEGEFVGFEGTAYFEASDGSGKKFYSYDGTTLAEPASGINNIDLSKGSQVLNGKMYYYSLDEAGGGNRKGIWSWDGSFSRYETNDPTLALSSSFESFDVWANRFYGDGVRFDEKFVRPYGTYQLEVITTLNSKSRVSFYPATFSSDLYASEDILYFFASHADSGVELWSFNGSALPSLVQDYQPDADGFVFTGSNTAARATIGSDFYFMAWNKSSWEEGALLQLFKSDGSTVAALFEAENIIQWGDAVYVSKKDASGASQLYELVNDIPTLIAALGNRSFSLDSAFIFNGNLMLWEDENTLYSFNGASLSLVNRFLYDPYRKIADAGDKLYFGTKGVNPLTSAYVGEELFVWDGTTFSLAVDVNTTSIAVDYGGYQTFVSPVEGDLDAVRFADANLTQAIRDALNKQTGDITYADLAGLTNLNGSGDSVVDLTLLELAYNLTDLDLSGTDVESLEVLGDLSSLQSLDITSTGLNLGMGSPQRSIVDALIAAGVTVLFDDPNMVSIDIADANLRQAIRDELGKQTGALTFGDMAMLTSLDLSGSSVLDLTELAEAYSLQALDVTSTNLRLAAGSFSRLFIDQLAESGVTVAFDSFVIPEVLLMAGETPQDGFSLYEVSNGLSTLLASYPEGRIPSSLGGEGGIDQEIVVIGDSIFFNMIAGGNDVELWRFSDGIFTLLLGGNTSMGHGIEVTNLVAVGNSLYCRVGDQVYWVDVEGTVAVPVSYDNEGEDLNIQIIVNLALGAFGADYNGNWWRMEGGSMVDTDESAVGSSLYNSTVINGVVYYSGSQRRNLYLFNGTTSKTIYVGSNTSAPLDLKSYIIFDTRNGYYSYGESSGINIIASSIALGDEFNGRYYYRRSLSSGLSELWYWDGTAVAEVLTLAGTDPLFTGNLGDIQSIESTGSELLVLWNNSLGEKELWSTLDGIHFSQIELPDEDFRYLDIQVVNENVIVVAGIYSSSNEKVYSYRGMVLSELLTPYEASEDGLLPTQGGGIFGLNGEVFFLADDGTGELLYNYDGGAVSEETRSIRNRSPSLWSNTQILDGKVYYHSLDSENGEAQRGLWSWDGTNAAFVTSDASFKAGSLQIWNGELERYIRSQHKDSLVSTSNISGLRLAFENMQGEVTETEVLEVNGSAFSGYVYSYNGIISFFSTGDLLYFFTKDSSIAGTELWVYNGTDAPAIVENNSPGANGYVFDNSVHYATSGNDLYFTAWNDYVYRPDVVNQLFRSNGTTVTALFEATGVIEWSDRVFYSKIENGASVTMEMVGGTPTEVAGFANKKLSVESSFIFNGSLMIWEGRTLYSFNGTSLTYVNQFQLSPDDLNETFYRRIVDTGTRLYFGVEGVNPETNIFVGLELFVWDGATYSLVADINATPTTLGFGSSQGYIPFAAAEFKELVVPDPYLEQAILRALGIQSGETVRHADMAWLTQLDASGLSVGDLTGLETAINIQNLDVSNNQIASVVPLEEIAGIDSLDIRSTHLELALGSPQRVIVEAMITAGVSVAFDVPPPIPGSVEVVWEDDYAGPLETTYEVWRSEVDNFGEAMLIGEDLTDKVYEDRTAEAGITYYYFIRPVRASEPETAMDSTAGARFLLTPEDLKASQGDFSDRVRLTWAKASGVETYSVFRAPSTSPNNLALLQSGVELPQFNDLTAEDGVVYFYAVASAGYGQESPIGEPASGYRIAGGITTVRASDGLFEDKIAVAWTAFPDATSYRILRSSASDSSTAATLVQGLASPSYDDVITSENQGITYFYWVRATVNGVEGPLSNADPGHVPVDRDTDIQIWGDNTFEQTKLPVGDLSDIVEIAAGVNHSLALRSDGTVVAWGRDDYGQATPPAGLTDVVEIAVGYDHSLALKADGTVVAWGRNTFGKATVPVALGAVIDIAAGAEHSLALLANGTVAAWGGNDDGQTFVPFSLSQVVEIASGGFHNIAMKADGTITVWGDNTYGQLNVPDSVDTVLGIASGWNHLLVILPDNTVLGWGDNSEGQLDAPSSIAPTSDDSSRLRIFAESADIVGIAGGLYHSLALTAGGELLSWGDNRSSQTDSPEGLLLVSKISAGDAYNITLAAFAEPRIQSVLTGGLAPLAQSDQMLKVRATGGADITYQWYVGGVALAGATEDTLVLGDVSESDTGAYTVKAISGGKEILSSAVAIDVDETVASISGTMVRILHAANGETLIVGLQTDPIGLRIGFRQGNVYYDIPKKNADLRLQAVINELGYSRAPTVEMDVFVSNVDTSPEGVWVETVGDLTIVHYPTVKGFNCVLQSSADLKEWVTVESVTEGGGNSRVYETQDSAKLYFRVVFTVQ